MMNDKSFIVLVTLSILLFVTACQAPRVVTVDSKQSPLDIPAPPPRQTEQKFEKTNYLLYLPDDYGKPDQRWPLIVYLHGRSLRGNDLGMLKNYGLAALLDKDLSIPFVVISPQCPPAR
ncbi:MAG TPA: hypothetical protein VGW36_00235, partial [Pyrinomonadaceae bacterium]|nr:hypothetical protein [Pyrinomonadaceae bacterium]